TEAIRIRGNKLGPEHVGMITLRAGLYLAHAETELAIADYDEAIRLDPKVLWVRYHRGYARTRRGAWDRALADFDDEKRLARHDKTRAGPCLQGRADCLALAGRTDAARAAFEECTRVYPERSHPVLATTAWCIDRPQGDYDEALKKLDEAAKGGMII